MKPLARAIAVLLAIAVMCCAPARAQDPWDKARRLSSLVIQLERQARYGEAIAVAERLLKIYENGVGTEHPHTATVLNNLASLHESLGHFPEALKLHRRALAIRESTLDPTQPDIAQSLNNLALLYTSAGEHAQALPLYQRALAIYEKNPGPEDPLTIKVLANLADLYRKTAQFARALPLYERALASLERNANQDADLTAGLLNNWADLYADMDQCGKALPLYRRALAIAEQARPGHPETAVIGSNLASCHQKAGQYAQALPLYRRALEVNEGVLGPDHPWTAIALDNLGSLYRDSGQYAEALPLLQRALAIREGKLPVGHPDIANSLSNLAGLYYAAGQYAQAEPLLTRALAIREAKLAADHPDIARSLNILGGLYHATGRHAQALPLLQRALMMTEKALGPEHADTSQRLNNLAAVHYASGRVAEALPLYLRALRIAAAAGAPERLWTTHGNLMDVYAPETAPGQTRSVSLPLAIWHGKQAVNALQAVSTGLRDVDRQMQASFLKSKSWYYTRLADLLVQEGRIAEAEQVLAMLKERELSDVVQRSELRKSHADDVGIERRISRENAELAERGAKYSSELAALERKSRLEELTPAEKARRDELRQAAQRWRDEHQRWLAGLPDLFAQSGRTISQTEDASSALQTRVRAEAGAVGLQYIVGDERIAIIVNTARGSFGRFSNVRREVLYGQIAALRKAILDRTDVRPAAQALHKTLIAPVQKDLDDAQATTLVLALTDKMRYVPFAALHDGQRYLIERHPLVLYASAGGGEPRASTRPWQVAALGLTQARPGYDALPAVQRELEGIVRTDASPQGVLPGRISLNQAFDREKLDDALSGQFSVVHVASHFNLTFGNESSSVLLTGSGEISLRELQELDYTQVEQLTLSACETGNGGGANENGREVEGLAAAVQRQGAKAVLATLWKVADASTAQLMQRFYAQRAQAVPVTRATALQQAQLTLLRGTAKDSVAVATEERSARRDGPTGGTTAAAPVDPSRPYAHPFFWAPFVLSGNWL